MALPRRRLRPTRRLGRPIRPVTPSVTTPIHEQPTEIGVPSVLEDLPNPETPRPRSQETTVTLPAIQDEMPSPESTEPQPPRKLEFHCACGARLIATTETYDKHSRCALCQTVLLLNLVYDPDQRSFEVVPFRVNPESGP